MITAAIGSPLGAHRTVRTRLKCGFAYTLNAYLLLTGASVGPRAFHFSVAPSRRLSVTEY